jgi:hypothetical protein
VTTIEINEPTTAAPGIGVPIPVQLNFDGSMLVVKNAYGLSSVWRKQ